MKITAIDKNTVKLLKTSQVITSVSGAVKELLENSLDANSKNVEINLYDDGLTQIEVKDDGCGISKKDAPFMALASYTSKIKNFEDLETLYTYGFRGEALQALCQAADVSISTRTENEEIATLYILDSDGNITKSESCHRSFGTTVQVKGLFKKMPVRRQLLFNTRRANQDLKYLETILKSFGIIQPPLRITYRRNKQIMFIKSSANDLIDSITNVIGKDLVSNLEWIEENCLEAKIQLMLPKKDLKDITLIYQPGNQYIFVNNRMLIHKELEKVLNKRILEYFHEGTPPSKKCLFFLNILVNPSDLDINLEPNKTKGLLKNEKEIIDNIDKILVIFYKLEEFQEEKNENRNGTLSINDNSGVESYNDNETEWPACKKRKMDLSRKSPVEQMIDVTETTRNNEHVSENRSLEQEKFMSAIIDVRRPVLSESDSNSDGEQSFIQKKNNVASKKSKIIEESITFNSEKNFFNLDKSVPTSETETLSQLPVVDLGEDFATQEIREKAVHIVRASELVSKNDDYAWPELGLSNDNILNESTKELKSTLKQSILSLNTTEKGELTLEVDKTNVGKEISTTTNADSWSRGQVPGIEGGVEVRVSNETRSVSEEKESNSNISTGFNVFFSQTRTELVKEHPEMSVPQIACLITNRWKEITSEEKAHYRRISGEKANQQKMQDMKFKKEKETVDKNKKRLLNMLKNMKSNKKNENLMPRTAVTMETNKMKVAKKFYEGAKNGKKNVVIGPIKPSLWIVKVASQFLLLNVAQMYKKLNFTEHTPNETSAQTLETLLRQWMTEKEDMSIMHVINTKI